ncbi:hypothetical protein JVT61DRAFT_10814 [Boletus reticuloceps]|uniref:Uncharacterized protein n=1 Tax=Boletus reticuloceps TaxID=495285 RepID=A0A8I3A5X5_9AGAM|nr:hypothetical protein JVT61DRAFT_10814 [Boletus reticuloceps]
MNGDNGTDAHPKRATLLSARLRDTENAATPELRSHQQVQIFESPNTVDISPQSDPEDDDHGSPPSVPCATSHKRKRIDPKQPLQTDLASDPENQPSTSSQLVKGVIYALNLYLIYIDFR